MYAFPFVEYIFVKLGIFSNLHLTFMATTCSNGPAFVSMCHALGSSVMSSATYALSCRPITTFILYCFKSFLMLSSHLFWTSLRVYFPSPAHVSSPLWYPPLPVIPSQSSLSEEVCHWINVGFSPDVFISGVILLIGLYIYIYIL